MRKVVPIAVLIVVGWILFGSCMFLAHRRREEERKRFAEELRATHPGRFAWHVDEDVYVLEAADLPHGDRAKKFEFKDEVLRVLWSRDGKTLYVVLDGGSTLDRVHTIERLDVATSQRRLLLDLKEARIEDNDLRHEQVFVTQWEDAEAAEERLVFQLGKGPWYSVEGLRARVRPVAGPPAAFRDQTHCPCGRHRIEHGSDDEDDWLDLHGPETSLRLTDDDVDDSGAWFCEK
jgi:hypothetical protein